MISLTIWQPVSVQDFFRDFNWSGQQATLEAPPSEQTEQAATAWQSLSVQEFFALNSWHGQAKVKTGELTALENKNPLTRSVAQFFGVVSWRKSQVLPSPTKNQSKSQLPDNSEVKLDDLSDLF